MNETVHTILTFNGRRFSITAEHDLASSWSDSGMLARTYLENPSRRGPLQTMLKNQAEFSINVALTREEYDILKTVNMGPEGHLVVTEAVKTKAQAFLGDRFLKDVRPYFEPSSIAYQKKITKEDLAGILTERQVGDEISEDEVEIARDAGLVVAFGTETNCIELRGAIEDEIPITGDAEVRIDSEGARRPWDPSDTKTEDEARKYFRRESLKAIILTAKGTPEFSWKLDINAPRAFFETLNHRTKFSRGLIFESKAIG